MFYSLRSFGKWPSFAVNSISMAIFAIGMSACKTREPIESTTKSGNLGSGLDTNDVSFLFPAPTNRDQLNLMIPLSGLPGGKALISKRAFDSVFEFAQDEKKADISLFTTPSVKNYANWRIVGLRVIACADSRKGHTASSMGDLSAEACMPQLRLVAQPVDERFSFEDQAIHLVYTRLKGEKASILKDFGVRLSSIKQAALAAGASTDGVPLGVHPSWKSGLKDGAVLDGIRGLVNTYAAYEGLHETAIFLTTAGAIGGSRGTHWHFFSVLIDPANANNPLLGPIPLEANGNFKQTRNGDLEVEHGPSRTNAGSPEIDALLGELRSGPVPDISTHLKRVTTLQGSALENALKIQDPSRTPIVTFENGKASLGTDCVSCHRSTPSIIGLGNLAMSVSKGAKNQGDLLENFPGAELSLDRQKGFSPPLGVTSFAAFSTLSNNEGYSFRNFGWVDFSGQQKVEISRYVVNESAMVAHQFNTIINPGKAPPLVLNANCTGSKLQALEKCIYGGGGMSCYARDKCR